MSSCVVLLSGGLDSTVLLTVLSRTGNECYPLTVVYGQRHSREVIAARNVCEFFGLAHRWKLVDLDCLRLLLPSALTGKGDIPEGDYTLQTLSQTVVPGRNLILIAIAVGYAQGLGLSEVYYAAHSGDHPVYPDCREEFVKAVSEVTQATYGVRVIAPFVRSSKADIVRQGLSYNAPLGMTWSCYRGGEHHCGKCSTCTERRKAFASVGAIDPTVYERGG